MHLAPALLLLVPLALVASGCSSPCARVNAAIDNVNRKGQACDSKPLEAWPAQRCEEGLSKCSPDDLEQLEAYAQCLDNVPTCVKGQEFSFNLAVFGCLQPLTQVSYNCASSTR